MGRGKKPRSPKKLPKHSRTKPMRGKGDDEGVWFRCWYCGFPCKVGRDSLGGRDSRSGVSTELAATANTPVPTQGEKSSVAIMGKFVGGFGRGLKQGADGTAQTVAHLQTPKITSGCPFCGSRNWRGDYP